MQKSILFTLFKLGRLPKKYSRAIEAEGIVLLDEGLSGSVTLRDFRAPGRFHSYKKSMFAGSLVLTEQRFAAFAFAKPVVDIPLHDDRLRALEISVPSDDRLYIVFDPSVFDLQQSGSVELRFRAVNARRYHDHLIGSG